MRHQGKEHAHTSPDQKPVTESGKRTLRAYRLSWANLLATLVILAALCPLVSIAYGAVTSYASLRVTVRQTTQDVRDVKSDVQREIEARQRGQKQMSDLQHEMDGKLDILIRRTK